MKFHLIIELLAVLIVSVTCSSCWLVDSDNVEDSDLLKQCYKYCRLYFECLDPSIDIEFSEADCTEECNQSLRDNSSLTPDRNLIYCARFDLCDKFQECIDSLQPAD